MPEISIVDTRNLIRVIKQTYQLDFGKYSFMYLRYRIDKFIRNHYLKYPDILITRLAEDPPLFYELLREIETPSTELFRDPEMWKVLTEEIIPLLVKLHGQIIIELPQCVEGNELFSLCILISNSGYTDKTTVRASFVSKHSMEKVKTGSLNPSSLELGMENYKNTGQLIPLTTFIKNKGGDYYIECESLEKVRFNVRNAHEHKISGSPHLIIFRNKLMEYTPEAGSQLSGKLVDSLYPGGFLVIGHKENLIGNSGLIKNYNRNERIYRKNQS